MTNSLLFSIIIPNYNKAENIPALLASIYDHYPYDDFEVFFMDDASTDTSVEKAQHFPACVYSVKTRVGPATLRNMAAREARGEYLLFIDSDIIIAPGTLLEFRNLCLMRKFDAVSGLEVLPPVIDNWIGNYRTLQIQDYWGKYRSGEANVEAWGATFGSIRQDLFHEIGGFNESYTGADVEDHELAARIYKEKVVLFSPLLAYRHTHPSALELMIKQFRRASQMVRFRKNVILNHSFYGWRFKIGHLLALLAFLGSIGCLIDVRWLYIVLMALVLNVYMQNYLICNALKAKGAAFAGYCFVISLMVSLCTIAGGCVGVCSRLRK